MTIELEKLYTELASLAHGLIKDARPDGLDETEEAINQILIRIDKEKRDPWLSVASRLKYLPKISLTSEQYMFLNDMGVTIWTNGAQEVFVFNDNMTFIVHCEQSRREP